MQCFRNEGKGIAYLINTRPFLSVALLFQLHSTAGYPIPVLGILLEAIVIPCPSGEIDGVVDVIILVNTGCIYDTKRRRLHWAFQGSPYLLHKELLASNIIKLLQ